MRSAALLLGGVLVLSLASAAPSRDDLAAVLSGTRIDQAGAHVGSLAIALDAIGRPGAMHAVAHAAPVLDGLEVQIARAPGVTEWWRSTPAGLEQGVTIAARPEGVGELELAVGVGEHLRLTSRDADAIEIADHEGRALATYTHLSIVDADGALVPARLAVAGERIAIRVDDTDARYPIVVDPLVVTIEAQLLASDGAALAFYGGAVSISDDGTRALVGASGAPVSGHADQGEAYVLVRSGTTWAQEAILLAPDGAANDFFGSSVSLSGDGTRAIVGSPEADISGRTNQGAAYVFVRAGGAWSLESKLTAATGTMNARYGQSVSFSSDATRVLVGAQAATPAPGRTFDGAAYVYLRSGSTWSEEAQLYSSDGTINGNLGGSVSLSGDATCAVAGSPGSSRAYVFSRTGTSWTQQARLDSPASAPTSQMGHAVAIARDATRLVVGAPSVNVGSNTAQGVLFVFVRSGTTWTMEAMLTASDGGTNDYLGFDSSSLALSSDGSRALVGNGSWMVSGAAYLFTRSGTSWTEDARIAAPSAMNRAFGRSVSLTPDGARALVGDDTQSIATVRTGSAYALRIAGMGTTGASCSGDADCLSGFCVDGVCCNVACGGNASDDCQACSAARTGGADGTCAALSSSIAPTVTCRAAADLCDRAEVCAPGSSSCPPDGVLDAASECRASAGACDVAETCDGASSACPADILIASGTHCGGVTGACSTPGMCNGSSPSCVGGTPLPAGTVCAAADPSRACDVDDVCDGVTDTCAPRAAAAGMPCRASTASCDPAEACDGASLTCPVDVRSCDDASVATDAGNDAGRDAGHDAGSDAGAADAALAVDAASAPPSAQGCACRTGSREGSRLGWIVVAMVVALATRRPARR